jgi:glycosyltransferase involved in cell wall biosynthesis
MENFVGHRLNRQFVGLFSVYAGDRDVQLFQALWTMLRYQDRPLDGCIGVVEGEINAGLERVVTEFTEVTWLRIPKVVNNLNFGLPTALNFGLDHVQPGDIVLKIDTDDLYPADRVARTVAAWNSNPNLGLFGGQVQEWLPDFSAYVGERRVPVSHASIMNYARRRNPFNGPTVAFDATLAKGVGGFAQVGANEDYVLWASLLAAGAESANDDAALAFMRGGPELVARRSTARTRKGELEALKAIRATGLFSPMTYVLHAAGKQLVRRMPLSWNRYLYRWLREPGWRPVPTVVPDALSALNAWNA